MIICNFGWVLVVSLIVVLGMVLVGSWLVKVGKVCFKIFVMLSMDSVLFVVVRKCLLLVCGVVMVSKCRLVMLWILI